MNQFITSHSALMKSPFMRFRLFALDSFFGNFWLIRYKRSIRQHGHNFPIAVDIERDAQSTTPFHFLADAVDKALAD